MPLRNNTAKGGSSPASCSPSLAQKIASALLTPYMGEEGTRLAIKLRQPDGTEKDLGGNCKQSIIDAINKVIVDHDANAGSDAPGAGEKP